jgi:hypothetical protein
MHIDTVQQRPADLLLVASDGLGGTTAGFDRVIVEAARAPVQIAVVTALFYLCCIFIMSLEEGTNGAL